MFVPHAPFVDFVSDEFSFHLRMQSAVFAVVNLLIWAWLIGFCDAATKAVGLEVISKYFE